MSAAQIGLWIALIVLAGISFLAVVIFIAEYGKGNDIKFRPTIIMVPFIIAALCYSLLKILLFIYDIFSALRYYNTSL